jgi:hypothetical protein
MTSPFVEELHFPNSAMVFTTPSGIGAEEVADPESESPQPLKMAMEIMDAPKNAFFILFSPL